MRVGLIALALAALPAATASAGESCDSGGGSSGGSSSGSSSDSSGGSSDYSSSDSSSSSTSAPAVPACVDGTDVHGYRTCTKFGTWSNNLRVPAIIIELGTAVRQFPSPLGERTGTVTHGEESFAYRVVGPGTANVAMDTAVVGTLRVGVGLRHGFYVAADGEAGGLTASQGSSEMTSSGVRGTPDFRQTHVVVLSGLGVLGVRARLGNLQLGAEAAGGLRTLTYSYQSNYLACEQTASFTTSMPVLEARARAALWVTPFISIGATAGKSVIDEAWVGGVYFNANSRAFGGN